MKWFRTTSKNSIILAPPQLGNLIPAYSAQQVYLGHYPETINFGIKYKEVEDFYKNLRLESYAFLMRAGITDTLVVNYDKYISEVNFSELDFLKSIYSNSQLTIYGVLF